MSDAAATWIAAQPEPHRSQLTRLNALICENAPDLSIDFKWSRPCYAGNGPVCYLYVAKAHVTLGFNRATALPDPDGLLEGTGKTMRHIKLSPNAPFDPAPIAALIRAAWALDQKTG